MSNTSQETEAISESFRWPSNIENCIWIVGLGLSVQCLIIQVLLFVGLPRVRKMDQKILTQLTAARLINNIMEFLISNMIMNEYTLDVTFALYLQTDLVMICWMFVYTRHLYEKVVLVFTLHKWNFILLSVLIWTIMIPSGVLCPITLMLGYFQQYYNLCAGLKFIVLAANIVFFCRILHVMVSRSRVCERNVSDIIKTIVITLLFVFLTILQVLVNDILSVFNVQSATDVFFIINSYQPLVATILFVMLSMNSKT
ncbi:hypothetical protein B5X24_HaOG211019 [Helicoverpa armigera]|nr:hypothetical protein B5X24_HaOG211019 [Helicoverpa armigera]